MTREEAIKVLSSYDVNGVWADVDGKPYNAEEQAEAFDMAIEALQTPPISQRSMYQAGYRQGQKDNLKASGKMTNTTCRDVRSVAICPIITTSLTIIIIATSARTAVAI